MKYLFLFVCLQFMTCQGGKKINKSLQPISLAFVQDGKTITPENHEVTLQKAPFTIISTFQKPWEVGIHISTNASLFQKAKAQTPYEQLTIFGHGHAFADYPFNKANMIMVDDEGFNYWFYESNEKHRFNSVEIEGDILIGKRIINEFYLPESRQLVEEYTNNDLYLVLIKSNRDYAQNLNEELYRDYLHIKFQ